MLFNVNRYFFLPRIYAMFDLKLIQQKRKQKRRILHRLYGDRGRQNDKRNEMMKLWMKESSFEGNRKVDLEDV